MIETILLVAGMATFVGTGASVGWLAGKRRGTSAAEAESGRRLAAMAVQRESAERRALDAQNESARWKGLSIAGQTFSNVPVYEERTSPRDAEELAGLLRGLTLLDDVVLGDRTGLPVTREGGRASADLAALAPHVLGMCRAMALTALPVTQINFETLAAEHICARPLTGRAEGAVLLVRTTSQRANPLAVDAVAHAAARTADDLGSRTARAARGSTDREAIEESHLAHVFSTLDRELGHDARGLMLTADGLPLYSAAKDGPSASARRAASIQLWSLQDRVARTLRTLGIVRVTVTLPDGDEVTWGALAPRSRLALVSFGRADARSGARLDRLIGTLRRGVGSGGAQVAMRGGMT